VQRVFWHSLRNPGKDVGFPRDFDFGLMTGDGAPLPAHRALRAFSRLLDGTVPQGRLARTDVEAYPFEDKRRRVEVLWTRKGSVSYPVPAGYKGARRLSLYGDDLGAIPKLPASVVVNEEPTYLELSK
jgi:hypothetical protein